MGVFRRVLVVEDDLDLARLSQVKLSELGYEVRLCHSARQARDAAKAFQPNVVLLDVMLGDGIGYQVSRAIRRDPMLYRTPLLFQSLLNEPREIAHAYEEGGDGYLTKPYSLENLASALKKMQRVSEDCEMKCPLTGLHSGVRLRREVDHRLFRGDSFALFYLMMEGLTVHHKKIQHSELDGITESIGRTLSKLIESAGFYEALPCHLGGGYFMVLTKLDDRTRFRKCLGESFVNSTSKLNNGDSNGRRSSHVTYIPGKLLVTYTHTERKEYRNASHMIEELRKADSEWKTKKPKKNRDAGHVSWLDEV